MPRQRVEHVLGSLLGRGWAVDDGTLSIEGDQSSEGRQRSRRLEARLSGKPPSERVDQSSRAGDN